MVCPELNVAVSGLLKELQTSGNHNAWAARLFERQIIVYLRRDLEEEVDPYRRRLRRQFDRLWEHVGERLEEDWTVARLAASVSMSQSHFHRMCVELCGGRPMRMVRRLRMERAESLLCETDEPLKIVAEQVGYRSEFAFMRAFRRFAGCSPTAFRRKTSL
jgi:AraC-like DNA-binding protein